MNNDDPNHPDNQIPDAEVVHQSSALTTRPTQAVEKTEGKTMTPAQAKLDAIASLTMTAYARASELKLTPDEIKGLEEEFPDDAFRAGASGKENLIYIEHAHLRDRFNKVFGHGQWAIIPRNRWSENYKAGRDQKDAVRVYVEAMLMVRGCFVGEAVGDMSYFPHNDSQNYGDAVEGAKTAAFRRCAKELGVGLQAWKKGWCEGWWERENAKRRGGRPAQNAPGASGGSPHPAQPPKAAPAPQPATRPAAKTSDVAPPATPPAEADEGQRFRFLAALSEYRTDAMRFAVKKGWITDLQALEALPNKFVPTMKKQYDAIMDEFKAFMSAPATPDGEAWRAFLMPFGKNKDVPLGELDKKYLFGLFMNYTVEEEYNGQPKSEEVIAKDREFRAMLDAAGVHYDWRKE